MEHTQTTPIPALASGANSAANDWTIQPTANYPGVHDPALGNFNGDGKADLAVINSQGIGIMLGNGDGTFQAPVNYTVGANPSDLAVGDFNGDGHLDLAFLTASGVSVMLGNGDGTFQAPVNTAAPSGRSLVVGDFNGDGRQDVAFLTGSYNCSVSVMLGNGDGTFQAPVNYPAGLDAFALATGDFTGDGKADLAVTNDTSALTDGRAGTVSILLGNGDGTFKPAVAYPTVDWPYFITVGDFNGDGKMDLAVQSYMEGSVSILLGNGDGTFQSPITDKLPSIAGWYSMAAGDFNGDGNLDVAVGLGGNEGSEVGVFPGNGDGTFQAPVYCDAGSTVGSVTAGDLNGDGCANLLVDTSAGISVFLSDAVPIPHVTNATTGENVPMAASLVIKPGTIDASSIASFQITGISGGTLFLNDGVTSVTDGEFITLAQGAAGLAFTPTTGSLANGSFTVQESTTADATGLLGEAASATITVLAPTPVVTGATTGEDVPTTGLPVAPGAVDTLLVTNFQITGISGGTLFLNDGVTPVTEGEFITVAQGAAGLIFVPTPGSLANGSFTAQDSTTADASGLLGDAATATITVLAPTPAVTNASTGEDAQTTSGLVITPGPVDASLVTNYQITSITGGSLFLNDGMTPITNGGFITVAQGAAGLRFTATAGSLARGSFTVQDSTTADASGLLGTTAAATITVLAPTPSVTSAMTGEDVQTTGGLVITPGSLDASLVTNYQITGISRGSLFLNDGVTSITDGEFITVAQGAAGLRFTPTTGSLANGSFTVQDSTTADSSGLLGTTAAATITVVPNAFVSALDEPDGLAFDAAGNLYVANDRNNTISRIARAGIISTFVVGGLDHPDGLAFDAAGNLYVANYGNNTISKVTPAGAVSTFVSSGIDEPEGLAFDAAGNLYVANYGNNTISKVTPAGAVSTFVSSGLDDPDGLAFDAAGNFYVANYGNNTISKVTPAGVVSTFVNFDFGSAPAYLAFDAAGNLYVGLDVADFDQGDYFEIFKVTRGDLSPPSSASRSMMTPRVWRSTRRATSTSPAPATTRSTR